MDGVRLTHVGGPTVLIEVGGWRLLTDPTFDPPGRRWAFGWGSSSRKLTGPAVAAADLGPVDAVLLTHDQHADNLDEAGRSLLASVSTVVTTPSAAARLGPSARGLTRWGTAELTSSGRPALEVTATPARHGPPLSRPIVGEVTGFALRWAGQDDGVLWISGDTVLFGGLREVTRRLRVDTALLHQGRVRFGTTGPVNYTMTARDAVELCHDLRPRTVVPVHYEGWSHFSEGRHAADREFARARDDVRRAIRWLPLGEAVEAAT